VSRAGGLGIVAGGYAGTMAGKPDLDTKLENYQLTLGGI
jgi:hypothetical protein